MASFTTKTVILLVLSFVWAWFYSRGQDLRVWSDVIKPVWRIGWRVGVLPVVYTATPLAKKLVRKKFGCKKHRGKQTTAIHLPRIATDILLLCVLIYSITHINIKNQVRLFYVSPCAIHLLAHELCCSIRMWHQ